MAARTTRRPVLALLTLLTGIAMPAAAAREDLQELGSMMLQVDRLLKAEKYERAGELARKMVQFAEQSDQLSPLLTARCRDKLAECLCASGSYAEARQLYLKAQESWKKAGKPYAFFLAKNLHDQAALYTIVGRYDDAESCHREALEIRSKLPKEIADRNKYVADSHQALGELYRRLGRYDKAERHIKGALKIRKKELPDDPVTANSFQALGELYRCQGRLLKAKPLFEEALKIYQKADDEPYAPLRRARCYGSIALLNFDLARQDPPEEDGQDYWTEAEQDYKKALEIIKEIRKRFGGRFPSFGLLDQADCLNNLGRLYHDQAYRRLGPQPDQRYQQAAQRYDQAMGILQANRVGSHARLVDTLNNLALLYYDRRKFDKAREKVGEAIKTLEDHREAVPLEFCYNSYYVQAKIAWETAGRRAQALGDLRKAMDLAIRQRVHGSGTAHDRARFFTQLANAFERMVAWQVTLGDVGEALSAMEQMRARSLLDQMQISRKDLLAGVPKARAQELRRRQYEAQAHVAELERQLQVLRRRKNLPAEQRKAKWKKIKAELDQARQDYIDARADICNESPAYRLAVGRNQEPVSLKTLKRAVDAENALLLEYLIGSEGGYVLIIPAGGPPRLEQLTLDVDQARTLGVGPGPLTAKRLATVLGDDTRPGILPWLSDQKNPENVRHAVPALAVLWELLIPAVERAAILKGQFKRLIVLPDGPLARLPLETLVVIPGEAPQYLLDAGPPIEYAPSATILHTLAQRTPRGGKSVLTVGDPDYSQLTRFDRLEHTDQETRWVEELFKKYGAKTTRLERKRATEAAVRAELPGRRVVHLACHGLAHKEHGNLFGALVFTPADETKPGNDGFLTLAEIYELDLKACELAILSACEMNIGPTQRGEGVWAITRGFLVAGAQRVVTTNWQVDDEASAQLISVFCSIVAQRLPGGRELDYADALQKAKQWIRNQSDHREWKLPYYWAPFVLMGPHGR